MSAHLLTRLLVGDTDQAPLAMEAGRGESKRRAASSELVDPAAQQRAIAAPDTDRRTIRGRVLVGQSLEAIEGAVVTAAAPGLPLVSTRTNATGEFTLRIAAERAAVLAEPGAQWTIDEPEVTWHAGETLAFQARTKTTGPLRVVLVDVQTREPVPYYALRVDGPGGETFTSGPSGKAETEGAFPPGRYALRLIDQRGTSSPGVMGFDHDPTREELAEISVPTGPTYRFDMRLPVSFGYAASDFRAFLAVRDDPRALTVTRLRNERGLWCRFPPLAPGSTPGFVVVESDDSTWSGYAPAFARSGAAGRTAIEIRKMTSIAGRVSMRSASSRIEVELEPLEDADCSPLMGRRVETKRGYFSFPRVFTGQFELRVFASGYGTRTLRADAGDHVRVDLK
ncbi:MAG: carboxypeptidase regulatory-like domain-containing protein [bacterium]|nr:carboxypeptidase regulatory-like domain-containing protein [bacterium]